MCAIDVPTAINQLGADLNASTASSDVAGGLGDSPDTNTCARLEVKAFIR